MNYFEDIYLLFSLNQYDESLQKQELKLKKIYSIDCGIANILSFKNSENIGRLFENFIYLELVRNKEVYFHKDKHECDFLIKEKDRIIEAIQVCYELTEENKKREITGLLEAMKKYKLKQGLIITNDQEETIKEDSKTIKVIPAWKWLLE